MTSSIRKAVSLLIGVGAAAVVLVSAVKAQFHCENCKFNDLYYYECLHFAADDPCSTTECIENHLFDASCELVAGAADNKCDTDRDNPPTFDLAQRTYDKDPCHSSATDFHLWRTNYWGCRKRCNSHDLFVRCDTDNCSGANATRGPAFRGNGHHCGCP